ncbi:MAG: 4-hydroxythreonine-4-phosphate dehydrogenase PdxA [Bacteroidetes bacterium]|nr:4-hydroxythreonine-4-phosphate dehydrogenase PdxA [Bacteroidota bacterium]MDA1120649.1 4-hydroxythreonine-4-phosphate dehydrogenase PdxA [Bacteroidota bacterium]
MEHNKNGLPVVGISIGDLNGIGPEVILKTFTDQRLLKFVIPVIYASHQVISFYRKRLDIENFNYHQAKNLDEINPKKVNVIGCWDKEVEIKPGEINNDGGKYAAISLIKAASDLKAGQIQALITAPIHKKNIQSEDFNFPGHTEFLTKYFDAEETLMTLISEKLRVGVVTGHIPLKNVADNITKDRLGKKIGVMEKSLMSDFGIQKPKIAVLGLNPHAGDDGLLGNEEERVISPVVEEFKKSGKLIFGPFSADGFFGALNYQKYDGVLAMYHDQGLIPFKTLSFQNGVNYTVGLPVIRTSPDHGTAHGIAGKGIADETSFREAVLLAVGIINQRIGMDSATQLSF